jgi:hypothetical protein
MHVCAEFSNEQLLSHFLKDKGEYLSRNYADETPFHVAAREGKYQILQFYFDNFSFDVDIETMVSRYYI